MDRRRYDASKSIAHGGGAAVSAGGSSKRKGKGAGRGGGGGRKPIKVVYIDNPMRVTTSAAGFRALVQELTGRNADPSRYSGGAAGDDADDSSGAASSGLQQPGALPSPGGSTDVSSDAAVTAAAVAASHVPAPACWEYDDDDSFPSQLIDNSYSVFSPPTFLYGSHSDMM